MPQVTVVYAATRNPLGLIARLFTMNATWNHGGVVVGDKVYEARMVFGVVDTPIEEFKRRCPKHTFVQFDVPEPEKGYAFARAQKGKGYDYKSASSVPVRGHWQDPELWECGEFIEAFLYACGLRRWRDTKARISPQESYDVL